MTVRVLQNRSIFGSVDPSIVAYAARSRFENRARAFCVRLSSCQSKWHLSACLMLLLSVQERTQPHQMNRSARRRAQHSYLCSHPARLQLRLRLRPDPGPTRLGVGSSVRFAFIIRGKCGFKCKSRGNPTLFIAYKQKSS